MESSKEYQTIEDFAFILAIEKGNLTNLVPSLQICRRDNFFRNHFDTCGTSFVIISIRFRNYFEPVSEPFRDFRNHSERFETISNLGTIPKLETIAKFGTISNLGIFLRMAGHSLRQNMATMICALHKTILTR